MLFGSTRRLASLGATVVAQGNDDSAACQRAEIPDTLSVTDERCGAALVAGDHDGDGRDDLAIGVPFQDFAVGCVTNSKAGVADVLDGTQVDGLTGTDAEDWSQATTGMLGGLEATAMTPRQGQ